MSRQTPVDFGTFWIFWIPERRGVAVFWLNWLTLEDSGKSGEKKFKKEVCLNKKAEICQESQ